LVDEELLEALELEAEGITVLLPRRAFVETCLDKFILMQQLKTAGISIPDTHLASDDLREVDFPAMVKPRRGRGSRGIGVVRSQPELAQFLKNSPLTPDELIVQTYIDGLEFTVSVTVWRDGVVHAVVPKEIICKKGITRLGITRRNSRIDALCRAVQNSLHADGPFNVQLCVDKTSEIPFIFEINPRFSTTVSLTIAAGVDEIGSLISYVTDKTATMLFGEWREGVVLLRRTLDEFIDEADFKKRLINIIDKSGVLNTGADLYSSYR
jgi:carbamoyl-phosphate synthase large subunit